MAMPPSSLGNYEALAWAANSLRRQWDLWARIAKLNVDEQRVLAEVLEFALQGLEKGRSSYGPMDLASDTRDLQHEAREELRDGQIYLAAAKIKQEDQEKLMNGQ